MELNHTSARSLRLAAAFRHVMAIARSTLSFTVCVPQSMPISQTTRQHLRGKTEQSRYLASRYTCLYVRSCLTALPSAWRRSDDLRDPLPHLYWIRVHRKVSAVTHFSQLHAVLAKRWQIGKRCVLLAIHEHPGKWQFEEAVHEARIIREIHHGAESVSQANLYKA